MKKMLKAVNEIREKYKFRIDADNEEEPSKRHTALSVRLPFALCKEEGIDTDGMTPREAWEAYKEKTGQGAKDATREIAYGKKIKASVRKVENRIKNDGVETAAVVDGKGKIVIDKSDGAVVSVSFTDDEVSQMKDGTLTHNHPSGTTFSVEDITISLKAGLKEMRACHKNGTFVLKRKFEIGEEVPEKYTDYSFPFDYHVAQREYQKNVVDAIWAQTHDADRCNKMCNDYKEKWLKEHSDEYGWEYREEKG